VKPHYWALTQPLTGRYHEIFEGGKVAMLQCNHKCPHSLHRLLLGIGKVKVFSLIILILLMNRFQPFSIRGIESDTLPDAICRLCLVVIRHPALAAKTKNFGFFTNKFYRNFLVWECYHPYRRCYLQTTPDVLLFAAAGGVLRRSDFQSMSILEGGSAPSHQGLVLTEK